MGEGEANPEWDEIAENTGLDHEQVGFASASFRFICLTFIEFCKTAELLIKLHKEHYQLVVVYVFELKYESRLPFIALNANYHL